MTTEGIENQYIAAIDVIQPGDLVIILLIALGIFVLIQFMNGIINITTARYMRKQMELKNQMDIQNSADLAERFDGIHESIACIQDCIDTIHFDVQYLRDDVYDALKMDRREEGIPRKRGKYGPRKRKALEHKKTPPEN